MYRFQKQWGLKQKAVKASAVRIRIMGMILFALLLTFIFWTLTAQANSSSFAIRIIQPENQIDPTRDFFDLQTYPGKSQVIQVELFNLSNQPIRIKARVSTATTNPYVQAEYRETGRPRDSTLPHLMEELVTMNNPEVTIDANSSIYFPLQIQMPEEGYDGVLAGGVNFQMVREESQLEGIELLVSFTTVILLWQGDLPEPELVLHEVEVVDLEERKDLERYRISIESGEESPRKLVFIGRLQNTQAAFAHGVSIKSQISHLDTGEIIFEEARSELQIVPHSSFEFHTFVDGEPFVDGYYLVTYFIESDGGSWELHRKVFVESNPLERAFHGQRSLEEQRSLAWVYMIILVVMISAGVGLSIYWHKQSLDLRK